MAVFDGLNFLPLKWRWHFLFDCSAQTSECFHVERETGGSGWWAGSCSAISVQPLSSRPSSLAAISVITALSTWLGCWLHACCHFRLGQSHICAQSCAEPSQRWLFSDGDVQACLHARSRFTEKCDVRCLSGVFKFYPWTEALESQVEQSLPTSHSTGASQAVAVGPGESGIISWSCLAEPNLYLSCFRSSLLAGQITWSFHTVGHRVKKVRAHPWDVPSWDYLVKCLIFSGGKGRFCWDSTQAQPLSWWVLRLVILGWLLYTKVFSLHFPICKTSMIIVGSSM